MVDHVAFGPILLGCVPTLLAFRSDGRFMDQFDPELFPFNGLVCLYPLRGTTCLNNDKENPPPPSMCSRVAGGCAYTTRSGDEEKEERRRSEV